MRSTLLTGWWLISALCLLLSSTLVDAVEQGASSDATADAPAVCLPQDVPQALLTPNIGKVYRIPVAAAYDTYGESADAWTSPDTFDYSHLDNVLANLLAGDPAAQIVLRVMLDSPPWWDDLYPALVVSGDPPGPGPAPRKSSHASWYSPRWQRTAAQALKMLVEHVDAATWSDHIVGYELAAGRAGAWEPWSMTRESWPSGPLVDAAYRIWLTRQYSDTEAWRLAWGLPRNPDPESPEVQAGLILTSINQATATGADEVWDPTAPALYEPSGMQPQIDFLRFLSEHKAAALLDLIEAGREASAQDRLWGACYGHLFHQPTGFWPATMRGQAALGMLLASPQVDFLSAPPDAEGTPTTAVGSLETAGKLWLGSAVGEKGASAGSTAGLLSSTVSFAYLVDEASLYMLNPQGPAYQLTLPAQLENLSQSGVTWKGWLPADLQRAADRHEILLLAAAYRWDQNLVDQLWAVRGSSDHTLVLLYAAGSVWEIVDTSQLRGVLSLATTVLASEGSLEVEIPPGDPHLTLEALENVTWGDPTPTWPRFGLVSGFGLNRGVNLTGSYADGISSIPPLGTRAGEGATVIYSAVPGLPVSVLQSLELGSL